MGYYLQLYLATLVAFFAIDMVWLGLVARTFYRKHLGYLMAEKPKWLAAMIFYLLFIVGVLVFAILPGLEDNSLRVTILNSAMFGLIAYATYDLTNLATLKGWPILITVVDLAWGTLVSVAVSVVGFFVGHLLA